LSRGVQKKIRGTGMRTILLAVIMVLAAAGPLRAQDKPVPAEVKQILYSTNFETTEIGKIPDDFLVLDGGFAVKADGTNKILELPGAPLDTFGVLFGPADRKADVEASARIRGTSKGRRSPTFGVGLNGQEGYKLQVSPAKKLLELYKADEVIASVGYEWKSGQWTAMKLAIVHTGPRSWTVEGKAWSEGSDEPKGPMVTSEQKFEPPAGRASIWGQPYATTPIDFSDLVVKEVGEAR
jgi:hypothetical protein